MEVMPSQDSLTKAYDGRPITPPSYRGSPYELRNRSVGSETPPPEPTGGGGMASAYEMLSATAPLGSGGYGTVVQARHLASGQVVAAKIVPFKPPFATPEALRTEYALLVKYTHAHIVQAHGIEEAPGVTTIFTELCTTDLFALTRSRGRLTEAESRQNIGQMLMAVEHLHALGVSHRDLKLENMLLDLQGQCKLCDFGLAHVFGGGHATAEERWLTEICGSRSYCAPEVLTGKGYDAYASDMWSMGICLFAMCAGFFPLDQASSVDWRYDRLKLALASDCSLAHSIFGFYDRQCTFSPELVELADALLTLQPARRRSATAARQAPFVTGTSIAMDTDAEMSMAPRYRLAQVSVLSAEQMRPSGVLRVIQADAEEQPVVTRPVYRSGQGPVAPPPELERQPPFRDGDGDDLARAVERLQQLPRELIREASERFGAKEGQCLIQ